MIEYVQGRNNRMINRPFGCIGRILQIPAGLRMNPGRRRPKLLRLPRTEPDTQARPALLDDVTRTVLTGIILACGTNQKIREDNTLDGDDRRSGISGDRIIPCRLTRIRPEA